MSTSSIILGLLTVILTCNIIVNVDSCSRGSFTCPNIKTSIPLSSRCDGLNSCGDRSDEEDCDKCINGAFHCSKTRECIPPFRKCDGNNDCGDRTDERECDTCNGGAFKCSNKRKCIPSSSRCNGYNGCDDWSDEDDCYSCTGKGNYCRNERECAPSHIKCDGDNHCADFNEENESNDYLEPRIVGGDSAHPNKWPFMASLLDPSSGKPFCGGAILTNRHILTAAHCTQKRQRDGQVDLLSPNQVVVRVGEYDFNSSSGTSQDVNVSEIRYHEQYNYTNYENDIAILELQEDITFNYYVNPVSLPPPNVSLTDRDAYVIGWGLTAYKGYPSKVLKEVKVPIWSHGRCKNAYNINFNKRMCAGLDAGGKDACKGDSGGPLLTKLPCFSDWRIVGVVSTGFECALAGKPGIYIRVSDYLEWITNHLH